MTLYENHTPVSNQLGIENNYGNVIVNNPESPHKRPRPETDESTAEKALDDDILGSLSFPQMFDRRSNIDPAHPHTCLWLSKLDEYKRWKTEPRGLLWIKGKPGSGKSTLIAHLHHDLELSRQVDCDVNLEFFFSARGTQLQYAFIGMLRSLLNQLYYRDHTIRHLLRTAYKEKSSYFGSRHSQIGWDWTLPELKRHFMDALLLSSQKHQIVILVDALDEAGDDARDIASYFHIINDQILQSGGMARICISCRPYPISSTVQAVQIVVEDHNHGDIALYIKHHIEVNDSAVDRFQQDLGVIARTLNENANGLFQWVRLVTPMVSKWIWEGETTEQILQNLSTVPKGLESVYEYVIVKLIEPRYRRKTLRLFQWVCLAPRPLSIIEIRYACSTEGIEIGEEPTRCHQVSDFEKSSLLMKSRVVAWSGGLLEIIPGKQKIFEIGSRLLSSSADDRDIVQVIHQSVKDFMIARGLSLLLALSDANSSVEISSLSLMDSTRAVQTSHSLLYLSCLKYLCTERPDRSLLRKRINGEHSYARTNTMRMQHSLLDYTTEFGLHHAEQTGNQRGLDLEQEGALLKKSSWTWILVYKVRRTERLYGGRLKLRPGTTVLHMASAADFSDLIKYRIINGDDLNRQDSKGWTALHTAASLGRLAAVTMLLEHGADIHAETVKGYTPLLLAASRGCRETAIFLLKRGADPNAVNKKSGTVLYAAACQASMEIIRLCIEIGADLDIPGGFYGNALQAAAAGYTSSSDKELNLKMVRLLLEAGADVNAQCGYYGNALQAAAHNDDQETIRILLEAGADINCVGGQYGTALQAAAEASYIPGKGTVAFLIAAGADVNAQGGVHGNVLQAAARASHKYNVEVVRLLLDAGANVNAQGGFCGNALQAAVRADNGEIVALLLAAGADVNAQGGEYGNALQAAAHHSTLHTVNLLLRAGADVNAQGGLYDYALQAAAKSHRLETKQIVERLLAAGAEVNAQGRSGGTALQEAATTATGSLAELSIGEDVVNLLLNAGADVNAQGGLYGNALQAVALYGWTADNDDDDEKAVEIKTRILRRLLEAGANVNAQGGKYGNALQAATRTRGGSVEPVRLLLEAGADVNAQGGEYGSALRSAQLLQHTAVVDMLLAAGAEPIELEVGADSDDDASSLMMFETDEGEDLMDVDAARSCKSGKRPSATTGKNSSSDASGGPRLLQMLSRFFP